jgi:SNF2 family DNA or RNA helicase
MATMSQPFSLLQETRSSVTNLAWLDGNEIRIAFKPPYNKFDQWVKECRAVAGRTWDGKHNIFPVRSAADVRSLTEAWGVPVSPEVELLEAWNTYVGMAQKGEYNVHMQNKSVVITFDYNPTLISVIHHYIPGVAWRGSQGVYKAPGDNVGEAIKFAHEFELTVDPEIEARIQRALDDAKELYEHSTLLDWEDFKIPGLVGELRPYQRAAVAYMQRVRRCILADQPGLGKTVTSISTVIYDQSLPAVVVCKNRLKETIREDFLKFYPDLQITVLNGGKLQEIPKSDVVIVNYDIAKQRLPDILEHGFKALIVDESHYIKNGRKRSTCTSCGYKVQSNAVNCKGCGKSGIKVNTRWDVRRTDAVMRLSMTLPQDALVLLLTGTPINIRPGELIRQLECIDRLDLFGGEYRFKKRYCPDNKTALNLQELNTKLRENCFIRRKTSDVYGQLPAIQNSIQRMVLTEEQMDRYREIEGDVIEYLADKARQRAKDMGEDHDAAYWNKRHRIERAEALLRVNALRGAVVDLKYEAMLEWIDTFLETGDEPILLFAERIKVVEGVYDRYSEMAVKVRGDITNEQALEATHTFQEQDWCRIFAANISSAKEGFTLTKAYHCAFMELMFAPTDHSQAASRGYGRANDPHGMTAYYLLAPGTIDYDQYDLLQERQKIVDAVTDGEELDEKQLSIEDQLIKMLEDRGMKNEG